MRPLGGRQASEEKVFFFEKKKQKTFEISFRCVVFPAGMGAAPKEQKFFGSFFQKRTASFLHVDAPRPLQRRNPPRATAG
jgi:hypothetical protein